MLDIKDANMTPRQFLFQYIFIFRNYKANFSWQLLPTSLTIFTDILKVDETLIQNVLYFPIQSLFRDNN